mmetsp:Transcript_29356/g.93618  ORF Transcript_29356/g.93618 Transcript_29356/m.93618 type:complete len:211 (-) Transcript_29356:325-957(-)
MVRLVEEDSRSQRRPTGRILVVDARPLAEQGVDSSLCELRHTSHKLPADPLLLLARCLRSIGLLRLLRRRLQEDGKHIQVPPARGPECCAVHGIVVDLGVGAGLQQPRHKVRVSLVSRIEQCMRACVVLEVWICFLLQITVGCLLHLRPIVVHAPGLLQEPVAEAPVEASLRRCAALLLLLYDVLADGQEAALAQHCKEAVHVVRELLLV